LNSPLPTVFFVFFFTQQVELSDKGTKYLLMLAMLALTLLDASNLIAFSNILLAPVYITTKHRYVSKNISRQLHNFLCGKGKRKCLNH